MPFENIENHKRGLLILIGGTDFAGKSTIIKRIVEDLRNRYSLNPLMFRAPGGTAIGENIRSALFKSGDEPHNETLIHGMLASHAQLIHQELIPALKQGHLVILDRFVESTQTYQGLTPKDEIRIARLIKELLPTYADGSTLVDKTFIIDVPLEVSKQRRLIRGSENFLDDKPDEFYIGIKKRLMTYVDNLKMTGQLVEVINNNVSMEIMHDNCVTLAKQIHDMWKVRQPK
jgi:dTMP kinase